MNKIISLAIWIIALIGLNGTLSLARNEWANGNICPKIVGIPACYIILTSFILILISQSGFIKDQAWLFIIGAGVAFLIAITGTVGQYFGGLECPKTSGGIPMCYLSLAMFSTLIILKFITHKLR